MIDSLRQQSYFRMRQAGQDRKISASHRKGYSCPMCEKEVYIRGKWVSQFIIHVVFMSHKKITCAPNEDSDQPGYPPRLIKSSLCTLMGAKNPTADAQVDPSLWWAHVILLVLSCSDASIFLYLTSVFLDESQQFFVLFIVPYLGPQVRT